MNFQIRNNNREGINPNNPSCPEIEVSTSGSYYLAPYNIIKAGFFNPSSIPRCVNISSASSATVQIDSPYQFWASMFGDEYKYPGSPVYINQTTINNTGSSSIIIDTPSGDDLASWFGTATGFPLTLGAGEVAQLSMMFSGEQTADDEGAISTASVDIVSVFPTPTPDPTVFVMNGSAVIQDDFKSGGTYNFFPIGQFVGSASQGSASTALGTYTFFERAITITKFSFQHNATSAVTTCGLYTGTSSLSTSGILGFVTSNPTANTWVTLTASATISAENLLGVRYVQAASPGSSTSFIWSIEYTY